MRLFLPVAALLLLIGGSYADAQNQQERVWFFGGGYAMQFIDNEALPGGIPAPPPGAEYLLEHGMPLSSVAASDEAGQLQFFIQLKSIIAPPQSYLYTQNSIKVFDRNGNPFPAGNILTNLNTGSNGSDIKPQVAPYPGQQGRYIIIYSNQFQLLYSIVDMQLNGGMGDIVAGQKDIPLTGVGAIEGDRVILLRGCYKNLWLLARSRTANEYLSFEISESGMSANPVVSTAGNLSPAAYSQSVYAMGGGYLTASNNGLRIAAGTSSGTELYDFEPCSGRLKHARVIDTFPSCGICFSPDDTRTRLYISHNIPFLIYSQGEIYQYSITAPSPAAIAASRTLVMRNPVYWVIGGGGLRYYTGPFGEIKQGLDNRLYVSKNIDYEYYSQSPPYYYISEPEHMPVPYNPNQPIEQGQYMHVINNPDDAGAGSNPQLDYIKISDMVFPAGRQLQSNIPNIITDEPDTAQGIVSDTSICFADSAGLIAADGSCYVWDNGTTEQQRTVYASGTYWVRYYKDCTVQTDTFHVIFIPVPEVLQLVHACEGNGVISIPQPDGFQGIYDYTLYDAADAWMATGSSSTGYSFEGLNTGNYSLNISTAFCDTTLPITMAAYPAAHVEASPTDTVIRYGDTIRLQASGAMQYLWWPPACLSNSTISSPDAFPLSPADYTVVGFNEYGCTDTATVAIGIDYSMSVQLPNAFSPNNDGLNDVFKIEGITYQKIGAFQVFNRWGEQIFDTTDPQEGWDGTYKGARCDVGVYHYYIRVIRPDGLEQGFKGDVTLIR